jgi:hypothetical protein
MQNISEQERIRRDAMNNQPLSAPPIMQTHLRMASN